MNKRIRYLKNSEGMLESVRVFRSNEGKEYKVILDSDNLTFKLVNVSDQSELTGSPSKKTLHALKIEAKQALMDNGVEFDNEGRERSKKDAESCSVLPTGI